MYIDVHCHLDILENPEQKINEAVKEGVEIIVPNSTNRNSIRNVLELAKEFNYLKPALGIYPNDALEMSEEELDEVIGLIRKNREDVSAIGEVGMDFVDVDEKIISRQKNIFSKFIILAKELDIPIIVHSRKAEKECIDLLEEMGSKRVIMHYFSGNMKLVKRIIKNNWFMSVPSCVEYNEHFQKLVVESPIDNLLCETDSPYSHPERKFPNHPKNVIFSYKKIAEIKKISLLDCSKKISQNFTKVFNL